ncbi:MAG: hypothetical protein ACKOPG_04855 [Novosphingobium sp.]
MAASHGGLYPAYLAAKLGLRGVIFSDAGRALDDSGIAGLYSLDRSGIPAAAISVASARIGDGADLMARGIIASVNQTAAALGCGEGMRCAEAADLFRKADVAACDDPPPYNEERIMLRDADPCIFALDSISLVQPGDLGAIVVSGSHGGLIGADRTAVKVDVLAAIYHDAGGGIDGAGFSRLPALDRIGIIGATVDGASARIGDGRSVWSTGTVSRCNALAARCGVISGMSVPELAERVASCATA